MSLVMDQQPDRTRHRSDRGAEAPPPRPLDRDRAGARVFVALIFAVTLVKGPGVLIRPL